jgi:hypothetical protein
MSDEEECVVFNVLSDDSHSDAFAIHIVILHRLTSRASLRDLARIHDRLALRPSERLSFVLDIPTTTPKAVLKAATRLVGRHNLLRHSIERPLIAASKALKDTPLYASDMLCILEGVVPRNTQFISSLVAGVSATAAEVLTLAPPSCRTMLATVGVLQEFAMHSPHLARHPDADLLLSCFYHGRHPTRGPLDLRSQETCDFLVQPLLAVDGPEVLPVDEAALTATLTRLGLHADRQQLPVLQAAAADARVRLRRAVSAHWRDDLDEQEVIHEILHAPFTGILPFCKWHGKSSAPLCVAAMFVEIGIRDAAIELGMKADGNAAFRCAMIVQFPEIKQRIEQVKQRAVRALVKSPLLQDNPRRARAEQE